MKSHYLQQSGQQQRVFFAMDLCKQGPPQHLVYIRHPPAPESVKDIKLLMGSLLKDVQAFNSH